MEVKHSNCFVYLRLLFRGRRKEGERSAPFCCLLSESGG
jgi:hypothetical protein